MNNRILLRLVCLLLLTTTARAGLVSWWPLDNTTEDRMGTNPGSWSGTATYTSTVAAPGSVAAAVTSNGTAPKQFVKAGTGIDFDGATPFSAMAWIQGNTQDSTIIGDMIHGGSYAGWELHVGTDYLSSNRGGLNIWLINSFPVNYLQVNGAGNVLDGQWHHVAFTYDASGSAAGVSIYVDGVAIATSVAANQLSGPIGNGGAAELNIGSRNSGAWHTFTGSIDDAAVFNHQLSAQEISQIYTNGLGSLLTPTVASTFPGNGDTVQSLTVVEVRFTTDVTGVNASDLLVNGVPATGLTPLTTRNYRFTFTQPANGPIAFTWAADHGIKDGTNRAFDGAGFSLTLDPTSPLSSVVISEFMAENGGGLEDVDHDAPDWIELTNQSASSVNLEGWSLTDKAASPKKWTFPANVSLNAGQRLLVFASNKDRVIPGAQLHTNFKISADGGYLALVRPDGTVAHVFENYPPQETNVSFGLPPGAVPAGGPGAWRYFPTSTPSAGNSTSNLSAAAIRSVSHSPAWPADADPISVTAQILPIPGAITAVTLYYRVQHDAEIALPMTAAGSDIYQAVIPASASSPGQMVRWRVAVTAGGVESRWPINNQAGVALPLYLGTTVRPSGVTTQLPLYEIFVQNYVKPPNVGGPYHAADGDSGARGAFAWQGVLYDNVFFRRKGTTSRDLYKRSHRVNFNPGHDFVWSPTESTEELNLNAEYPDPSYIRQYLSLWMHREVGVGAAPHFPVRVHMNGEFWQLAFHTLAADKDILHFMHLNDHGAIYKQVGVLQPGSPEKENRTWESSADYIAFATAIGESNANRFNAVYDTTDLATVINYLAVARLAQEADDVWANMVLYRDSEGSLDWRPIPFDLNLSFGQLFYDGQSWNTVVHATMDNNKSHPLYGSAVCRTQYPGNYSYNNLWNRLYDVVIRDPQTCSMLLRRMRTLLDQFYKPPGTPYPERPLEAEVDAVWARIQAEAVLDRQAWGFPPNAGVYGLGPIQPAQAIADLKNLYLDPRRTHFYVTHSVNNTAKPIGLTNTDNAGIPDAQPANAGVEFVGVDFAPASGNPDEEFIQLINLNPYAVDLSGWQLSGGVTHTMKGGTVLAAGDSLYLSPNVSAFRARATSPHVGERRYVQGNYNGHLSSLGETLTLKNTAGGTVSTYTYSGNATPAQTYLAISALGYGPANGDAEFIELVNLSTTETLDLTGVHFSKGVEFTFTGSAITTLAPGARVLVVRNIAAFQSVYGAGKPIAGEFANGSRLDNAGETLKLDDSADQTIFEFTYAATTPWPGEGVIVVPSPHNGQHVEDPANWRLPVVAGGTPGVAETTTPFSGTAAQIIPYATGGNAALGVALETLPGESNPAIVLSFRRALAADGAVIVPQAVGALAPGAAWLADEAHLVKLGESRIGTSGQSLVRYRVIGFASPARAFVRLQVLSRN